MKYALNVKAIRVGEFNLEDASFEVSYEATEIKDMLTHLLPFVKTMVDTVTEKVVPLVRDIKAADREYYDTKEALQREHELTLARIRAGQAE